MAQVQKVLAGRVELVLAGADMAERGLAVQIL